ncbi:hypothetical protein EXS74_01725 [Candidatus Woesearchaeota archaeon]|nr:hypothetical protein [Candidatus Woesearchaeota archaeon]
MAPVYRTFPLDTKSLDKEIDAGRMTPEEIGRSVGTTIDRLARNNFEPARGENTPKGYPGEILVGGKDNEVIGRGFREAIRGTPLGDYISEGGKTYTR